MKAKKGISLIVLVITIIVIIILAAAVLLTLNNNNPIENSKTATFNNDSAEVKSAMALYISNFMAKDYTHDGPFEMKENVANIKIVASYDSTNKKATNSTADAEVVYGTAVTWKDLGFETKPVSIESAEYNAYTGVFTINAAQGYGKVITSEDPDETNP